MKWTEESISEWHKETFPNATLASQLLKMHEELLELQNTDVEDTDKFTEELADCLIVASTLAGRFKSPVGNLIVSTLLPDKNLPAVCLHIMYAINEKMEKNLKRKWKKHKGVYRHDD